MYFLVAGTGDFLKGKKVLVSFGWINRIDGNESKIYMNFAQEFIMDVPEYDPTWPDEVVNEAKRTEDGTVHPGG